MRGACETHERRLTLRAGVHVATTPTYNRSFIIGPWVNFCQHLCYEKTLGKGARKNMLCSAMSTGFELLMEKAQTRVTNTSRHGVMYRVLQSRVGAAALLPTSHSQ